MNENPLGMPLEVDTMIPAAVTVQGAPIPLDLAELFTAQGGEILGKDLELSQQVKLEILGKGAHFRRADGIEDDLEHAVKSNGGKSPRKPRIYFSDLSSRTGCGIGR